MVNLIIVDDEAIIQKGLSRVPWHTINVNLVKSVSNGAEALQIIKTSTVHILFTDIQMPDINGLELIKAARLLNADIEGVILTGHSRFDYAKEALGLHVYDYILKPCSPKEVLEIIGRLASKIEKEQKQQELLSNTVSKLKEREAQQVLSKLLMQPDSFSLHPDKFSYLPQSLQTGRSFQAGLFSFSHPTAFDGLSFVGATIVKQSDETGLVLFSSPEIECNFENDIWDFFSMIKERFPDSRPTFGVGKGVNSLSDLNISYEGAQISKSIFFSHHQIDYLFYADIESKLVEDTPDQIIQDLLHSVEQYNYAAISDYLMQLQEFYRTRYELPAQIRTVIIDLCIFVCNLIAVKKGEQFSGLSAEQLLQITQSKDLEELIALTETLIFHCIDVLNNACNLPAPRIVQECRGYVEAHYSEEINLSKAAETIHISSDYLGRILKKETGLSFSQILINMRLEKACVFLSDINLSISDISLQVGFKDFRHFGQMFKSRYHMTPSEYRKTLINRNTSLK